MERPRRGTNDPHVASLPSGTVLTPSHVQHAFQQATSDPTSLNLSNLDLVDISIEAIQDLASIGKEYADDEGTVYRIALGSNRLTDLPQSFSLLTRLRYLNLRSNGLRAFPSVLCSMNSLEILDLSRNKIEAFPSQPGALLKLRVLHLGNNHIHSLPTYFPQFREINLLKIHHNPITWPPQELIRSHGGSEDPAVVSAWLESIKRWIQAQDEFAEIPAHPPNPSTNTTTEVDLTTDDDQSVPFRFQSESLQTRSHMKNPSIDSMASYHSQFNAFSSPSRNSPASRDVAPSFRQEPPKGQPTSDIDFPVQRDDFGDPMGPLLHGRNASFSGGGRTGVNKHTITSKKSLPELRTFKLSTERRARSRAPTMDYETTSPILESGEDSPPNGNSFTNGDTIRKTPTRTTQDSPRDAQPPPMDGERNQYFKRHSTLPSSTISKAVPKSLLVTMDGARGILFSLSQVYSALRHYTVFAINDRLSGVLVKVLDPASGFLSGLIGALDRFDSLCRRGTPPPSACRGVLESCRDNLNVFSKVVGILQRHLIAIAGSDDVRYTRTLLLMLYGSMAELSNSWKSMEPHISSIQSLLQDKSGSSIASIGANGHAPTLSTSVPPVIPPTIDETDEQHEPSSATPVARYPTSTMGRARNGTRRNAGSFSTKDLQLGKTMPTAPGAQLVAPLSITSPSPASSSLRTLLKNPTGMPSPIVPVAPNNSTGSPASLHPQPFASTPPSAHPSAHSRESSISQIHNLLNPPHSARSHKDRFVDGSTLDTLEESTDLAESVWDQVENEVLSTLSPSHLREAKELGLSHEYLAKTRESIRELKRNIKLLREGTHEDDLGGIVYEEAAFFAKDVANVASMLIGIKDMFKLQLDPFLRSNVQNLLRSTQEYATFLDFTSFASATNRTGAMTPASPALSNHSFTNGTGTNGTPPTSSLSPPGEHPSTSLPTGLGISNGTSTPPSSLVFRSRSANATMTGVGTGVGMPFTHPSHPNSSVSSFRSPTPGGGRSNRPIGGGIVGYNTTSD